MFYFLISSVDGNEIIIKCLTLQNCTSCSNEVLTFTFYYSLINRLIVYLQSYQCQCNERNYFKCDVVNHELLYFYRYSGLHYFYLHYLISIKR